MEVEEVGIKNAKSNSLITGPITLMNLESTDQIYSGYSNSTELKGLKEIEEIEETEKFKYFQNFRIKENLNKESKNLMIVEFNQKQPNFPNVAVLKEFKSANLRCKEEAKMLEILSELHPSIIKPYYYTEIDEKFRIFIEYCEFGSLSRLIKERKIQNRPWQDSELINHFITIADAINTLHLKNIVHKDIKPDNIFVKANEELKLGDFGDTKEIHIGESKFETLGALQYKSPHFKKIYSSIIPDKDGMKSTELVDPQKEEIWSVAKTVYEMATLNLSTSFPDEEDDIVDIVVNEMRSRPRRLINLLIWMLKDEFAKRPAMIEALEILYNIKDEIDKTDSDSKSHLKEIPQALPEEFLEKKREYLELYFQNFNETGFLYKSRKDWKIVHFTLDGLQSLPKIAILKEFNKVSDDIKKEVNFLKEMSALHPNIVECYHYTEFEGKFRIFMEYFQCNSISKLINERKNINKLWTDLELISHFITIAEVIKALHDKNYVHRDIKPDNIFVKDNEILKIGDFGDSKEIRIGESPSYWKSLKLFPKDKYGKVRDDINRLKEEEIWSLGKTFYEMATLNLYTDFSDLNESKIMDKVENSIMRRLPNLIKLLKSMLIGNHKIRPNITQVLNDLENIMQEIKISSLKCTTSEGNPFEIEQLRNSNDQNNSYRYSFGSHYSSLGKYFAHHSKNSQEEFMQSQHNSPQNVDSFEIEISDQNKEVYFQNFNSTDIMSKVSKNLKIVHFTLKASQDLPKIAILKEFYGVRDDYKNEAIFLKNWSLLHPNIVKYYYDTVFDGRFRIFMEHCECGSLSKLIKERKDTNNPWIDLELINHFITIADVIKTLHDNNYVHRDMKPDNIFVKDNEILKIGDFGDSKEIRIGETQYTVGGTKIYMSPSYWKFTESLPVDKNKKRKANINRLKEEEVWSVGKTFYEMAALDVYADFPDLEERYMKRVELFMSKRPERLVNLLKLMLKDNYTERPNITEVLTELINIKQEVEKAPLLSNAIRKTDAILQETEIKSSNLETNEINEENLYNFNEFRASSSQSSLDGFFRHTFDNRLSESIQRPCCELCNNEILMHECGLEYGKEYLLGYILASLSICNNSQEIVCINCLRSLQINTHNCLKHHFL